MDDSVCANNVHLYAAIFRARPLAPPLPLTLLQVVRVSSFGPKERRDEPSIVYQHISGRADSAGWQSGQNQWKNDSNQPGGDEGAKSRQEPVDEGDAASSR